MPVKARKHCFVLTANGTSAHRHGPFIDRETAIEWVGKHYANWPCWLAEAEYIGKPPSMPLDADGERVREG